MISWNHDGSIAIADVTCIEVLQGTINAFVAAALRLRYLATWQATILRFLQNSTVPGRSESLTAEFTGFSKGGQRFRSTNVLQFAQHMGNLAQIVLQVAAKSPSDWGLTGIKQSKLNGPVQKQNHWFCVINSVWELWPLCCALAKWCTSGPRWPVGQSTIHGAEFAIAVLAELFRPWIAKVSQVKTEFCKWQSTTVPPDIYVVVQEKERIHTSKCVLGLIHVCASARSALANLLRATRSIGAVEMKSNWKETDLSNGGKKTWGYTDLTKVCQTSKCFAVLPVLLDVRTGACFLL